MAVSTAAVLTDPFVGVSTAHFVAAVVVVAAAAAAAAAAASPPPPPLRPSYTS